MRDVPQDLPFRSVTQGDTLDEVTTNIRATIGLHPEGDNLAWSGLGENPAVVAVMELEAKVPDALGRQPVMNFLAIRLTKYLERGLNPS